MNRLYRLCRPSSFVSSQSSISYKLSAVSYRLSSIVCRVSLVAYRPPLQPIADRRYRRYVSSLSFKVESIIPAVNTNRSQLDNLTVSLGMSMNDDSGLVKKVAQFLTLSLSEQPLRRIRVLRKLTFRGKVRGPETNPRGRGGSLPTHGNGVTTALRLQFKSQKV